MRPASEHFLASLRISHVIASSCDLVFPDGTTTTVPVEGGSVTIDRTAEHRRTGTVQIPWSLEAGENLGVDLRTLPLGGYALLRRGLRYATGTELILLGHLRVESVAWATLEASATLELADRMAQVRDEPFTAPFAAKGKTPAQAAVEIVKGVFGNSIEYLTPYQPTGTIGDITYSGARTDALSDLGQSFSAECYFNADGAFVFAARPGDDEPVVWTVDAGETGVMVDAQENLDRTGIYNGVLVTAQPEADQPPIIALATYNDPASPINWGGPFGKVALLADSSAATSQAQAAAVAQSLLALRLKQTRTLELTNAPNPALEAGDTIGVAFPDGRRETHLIDATQIGLDTDSQKITTRTLAAPLGQMQALSGQQAWAEVRDAALVTA